MITPCAGLTTIAFGILRGVFGGPDPDDSRDMIEQFSPSFDSVLRNSIFFGSKRFILKYQQDFQYSPFEKKLRSYKSA